MLSPESRVPTRPQPSFPPSNRTTGDLLFFQARASISLFGALWMPFPQLDPLHHCLLHHFILQSPSEMPGLPESLTWYPELAMNSSSLPSPEHTLTASLLRSSLHSAPHPPTLPPPLHPSFSGTSLTTTLYSPSYLQKRHGVYDKDLLK